MTAALATSAPAEPPGGRTLLDREFRAVLAQVPAIRSDVRARLREEASIPAATADDALAVLGELIANSCLHAAGSTVRVLVALIEDIGILTGVVHDDGPGSITLPCPRTRQSPDREGGFGLGIVTALADTCGARRTRHGKEVYFALHLNDRAVPDTRA
ncbi:ATP-binding protein [Yinghuangia sp. YIM S09857]|uniref:ATP-binding protein n=1 Tax=Yinghuangia sp. YIM S09857 TaxID=3436929 RepID=UPI003F52AE82